MKTSIKTDTGQLRLIATTDVHVHLLPQDYFTERAVPSAPCLVRLAGHIAEARSETEAHLLLDNGDFLQGTPMADAYLADRATGGHPAIRAMNRLGYDAVTLGNHEFNYGLAVLERELAHSVFPVVATNLRFLDPEFAPVNRPRRFLLLQKRISPDPDLPPLKIGLLGFVPPQILQWDRQHLAGRVEVDDILAAAAPGVAALRAAGAECVVALCHSGLAPFSTPYHPEAAGAHLAALPGIDAVICGHGHLLFPHPDGPKDPEFDAARGTVRGTLLVMPGANAGHLGIIDLDLRHDGRCWAVTRGRGLLRPIGDAVPDPVLSADLADDHERSLRFIRRRVGQTAARLHSYFALLGRSTALSLVAEAQRAAVVAALRATGADHPPVLAAVAPFKAGGRGGAGNFTDIPPGELHLSHVADLYIFPNDLAAVQVTGAELREWLEHAASIYRRIAPPSAAGQPPVALIDPDFPGYNSDMIHGLDFTIDLARPARYDRHGLRLSDAPGRIGAIRHNGRVIRPEDRFVIATNSYRLSGSGGYLAGGTDRGLAIAKTDLRAVLTRHLARHVPVYPQPGPGFRLVAPAGARAVLETGPPAAELLAEIADLRPQVVGQDAYGFLQVTLDF